MLSPSKGTSVFQTTTAFLLNGKSVVDFAESFSLPALKKFVHNAYLEGSSIWLSATVDYVSTAERVYICRFDWDADSFCIINPEGKWGKHSQNGVIVVDVNGLMSVRVGLAWSQVERHPYMFRCFFLGSEFSRNANYPSDHHIFRFHALVDRSDMILDPHFDKCRIPSFDRSQRKIGDWAPEGNYNYDIRRNSSICIENNEIIANNCQMAVFEQLKTAGYIAFANFKKFCSECDMPEDFLRVPTSTLEMIPTERRRPFVGAVEVIDCKSVLEWQHNNAGKTKRIILELQCVTPAEGEPGTTLAPDLSPGPPVCHLIFSMSFITSDSTKKLSHRGHVLVDSRTETARFHSGSIDSYWDDQTFVSVSERDDKSIHSAYGLK